MDGRLLHRRGSLFARHHLPRSCCRRSQPAARFSLQIFATDLDRDAIDSGARRSSIPASIAADVSARIA
jgi:hypothetical protein